MKFVNGYEEGFPGATGWDYNEHFECIECKHKPFYVYTSNGIIIVDAGGISYYDSNLLDEYGNLKGWANWNDIKTYSDALNIVKTLESLDLDEFVEYIKLTYNIV